MGAVEAVTGLAGMALMFWVAIAYARIRGSRPRLCACGHGSGMHHMDGRCRGRSPVTNGAGVTHDRICGCSHFDGMGARVR